MLTWLANFAADIVENLPLVWVPAPAAPQAQPKEVERKREEHVRKKLRTARKRATAE